MNESLSSYVLASFSAGMAATFLVAYLALRFYGNKEEHSDRVERQRDKADMQILLNSYRAVESDAELNLAISACWRSGIPATPEIHGTRIKAGRVLAITRLFGGTVG